MDDMLFPSYKSSVARTQLTTFNESELERLRRSEVANICFRSWRCNGPRD